MSRPGPDDGGTPITGSRPARGLTVAALLAFLGVLVVYFDRPGATGARLALFLALGSVASVAGCSSLPIVGGGGGSGGGLSYGSEVNGELTEDDDTEPFRNVVADAYEFSGSSGDAVSITMTSEPLDPYLLLADANGELVAENDDDDSVEGTFNSRIATELPADGTYTVWASRFAPAGFSGEATGAYTVSLEQV